MLEQLKQNVAQLRDYQNFSAERIDAINDAVWKICFNDTSFAVQTSAEIIPLALQNGYHRGYAYSLKNIAWCQLNNDEPQKAEITLDNCQQIFTSMKDKAGLAAVKNALAITKRKTGNLNLALENHFAALSLYKEINYSPDVAGVLNNIGVVYNQQGEYAKALDFYYQALTLTKEEQGGAAAVRARILVCLSDVLCRLKETESAISNLQRALLLFDQYPDRRNECVALINLGSAYYSQQQPQKALEYYFRGADSAECANNCEAQAEAQQSVGTVYFDAGQIDLSITHFQKALKISQKIKNIFSVSETLFSLGAAYFQIGKVKQSVDYFYQALELANKHEFKEICAKAHLALSEACEKQNKSSAALFHFRSFHQIWEHIYGFQATRKIQQLLFSKKLSNDAFNNFPQIENQGFEKKPQTACDLNYKTLQLPLKLRKVIEFIDCNLEQNLTLSQMSEAVSLSRRHLQNLFKNATGKTLHRYLIEQRVERAKVLLQTTDLSLAEVSLACGFSDQSHLTTYFRLLTGTTPFKFRQFS